MLFDDASYRCGQVITSTYSSSFSLAIRFLHKDFIRPIHGIYGFVRLADEIVDSFHDYPKKDLLQRFRQDAYRALDEGISLNPVLNAFQATVRKYDIDRGLVERFLHSMEMDLERTAFDQSRFEEYVLGSAEVVGLMCLKVFCEEDRQLYNQLTPSAMKLGSAFQKINFLRDMKADYESLGRSYFPGLEVRHFDEKTKKRIEADIRNDFDEGYKGILLLPKKARFGVYLAYVYYNALLKKISSMQSTAILTNRIGISNQRKLALLFGGYLRHSFNMI